MPVLRKEKFIFVHVPKTGGSSIEKALGLHPNDVVDNEYYLSGLDVQLQHLTLDKIAQRLKIDGEDLTQYRVLGMVRNPLDRMLSEFKWRTKIRHKIIEGEDINTFVKKIYSKKISNEKLDSHFTSQFEFFSTEEKFKSIDIMTFENGFSQIEEYLNENLDGFEAVISKVNHTDHIDSSKMKFSDSSVQMVEEMYSRDYELFYRSN